MCTVTCRVSTDTAIPCIPHALNYAHNHSVVVHDIMHTSLWLFGLHSTELAMYTNLRIPAIWTAPTRRENVVSTNEISFGCGTMCFAREPV